MNWAQNLFLLVACVFAMMISGCASAPPPTEDYVLARAAIEAAKAVDSARFAPNYWSYANDSYRKAKVLFDNHDYSSAQVEFQKTRQFAEKAENAARLIRQKKGDVL